MWVFFSFIAFESLRIVEFFRSEVSCSFEIGSQFLNLSGLFLIVSDPLMKTSIGKCL